MSWCVVGRREAKPKLSRDRKLRCAAYVLAMRSHLELGGEGCFPSWFQCCVRTGYAFALGARWGGCFASWFQKCQTTWEHQGSRELWNNSHCLQVTSRLQHFHSSELRHPRIILFTTERIQENQSVTRGVMAVSFEAFPNTCMWCQHERPKTDCKNDDCVKRAITPGV